jgi:signal transduction histidine kinase
MSAAIDQETVVAIAPATATAPVTVPLASRHGGLRDSRRPVRAASGDESAAPGTFAGQERFAACVAHELRTPLATQRALLELALCDPNADVAAWREIGEDVLAACKQQERLLEACLALARSQGRRPRSEPVDLATIAAEALHAHDLGKLESDTKLEPARTTGDPDLLERLAANLVSNAIRHNIVGGRIEVTSRTESGRAVFSVANTGPFVPAAELQRLFQPFQRLNSNPRSLSDGAGLGLAIVRAIADAHSALATARARADGGLEIDVSFPATLDSKTAYRAANCTASTNVTIPSGSAASRHADGSGEHDHPTLRRER